MDGPRVDPLHWQQVYRLFDAGGPLLVFVIDGMSEDWSDVPEDVLAILDGMQSNAAAPVRMYSVDFRVDPDFLDLFSISRGIAVVRRVPGDDGFAILRGAFTYGALIEFCRPAFRPAPPKPQPRQMFAASGEITVPN